MKLPQGVGQVYKLSGSRRNPYIVRKTVGFIESKGKKTNYKNYRICKNISRRIFNAYEL